MLDLLVTPDSQQQFVSWLFTPFVITFSDFLLVFYLCRGNLGRKRPLILQILIMVALVITGVFAQFALNGHDGQQGVIYIWLITKYLLLWLALRLFTTMLPRAIFFYSAVFLLISDLSLMALVRLGFFLFDVDLLTAGVLWQQSLAHLTLIVFKLAALLVAGRFIPPKVYGIDTVRKALFVVVPAIPYIYMRDFPNWLNLLPSQISDSVQFMTMLTGVCALTVMIGNERVAYQVIRNETQRIDDTIRRRHEQFIARSNAVDEVNRRYHDLKYLLQGIEGMQSIDEIKDSVRSVQSSIANFENDFETGNKTLDIVLSDKARICQEKGVRFIPIINSQGWEHIAPIDISTIFGNALDNAIESASRIEQEDMRRVTVRVSQVNRMLVVRFENYYTHELKNDHGELLTTKEDLQGHGYGMKSMRNVVERLSGDMNIETAHDHFVLTIVIPLT